MLNPIERIKNFQKLILSTDPLSDDNFVLIINLGKDNLNISNEDIAIRFATTEKVISDWVHGQNLPSIGLRSLVFDWLKEKSSIDIDTIDQLIDQLQNIDINSDIEFNRLVKLTMLVCSINKELFAKEFDMSRPSMRRICNGEGRPHPFIRKHMCNWFVKQLNKLKDMPSE